MELSNKKYFKHLRRPVVIEYDRRYMYLVAGAKSPPPPPFTKFLDMPLDMDVEGLPLP